MQNAELLVAIIDYDAGNLRNVQKALEYLGYRTSIVSSRVEDLERADVLILPGVGAFYEGMRILRKRQLDSFLHQEVIGKKKPLLGICLGMQLLSNDGCEGGQCSGLGFLPMSTQKLRSEEKGFRLPHIGWNDVSFKPDSVLFKGIPESPDFYFVHSYHAVCEDESIAAATCEYGHTFVAAVEKDNIFGTQFHPEKSQRYGLKLLQNFMAYCESRIQKGSRGRC
jgi:glutamine amidotransferase